LPTDKAKITKNTAGDLTAGNPGSESPAPKKPELQKSNDPLHGLTLEKILTHLVESYGWEQLAENIRINCFTSNPSIQSSLKFLRKTPWARTKVEDFYKYSLRKKKLK
jgi:uncharacterized protein (DUF2132 family)